MLTYSLMQDHCSHSLEQTTRIRIMTLNTQGNGVITHQLPGLLLAHDAQFILVGHWFLLLLLLLLGLHRCHIQNHSNAIGLVGV